MGLQEPWTREREQLGPGWLPPNCSRQEEEEMHGALQPDSWVSLARGLILACHLRLLPAVGQRGAGGGADGAQGQIATWVGGGGLPPKKLVKSLVA